MARDEVVPRHEAVAGDDAAPRAAAPGDRARARDGAGRPVAPPRIVLATRNPAKLAELRRLLIPRMPGVEVLGLADVPPFAEPAETESTFAGNARLKARAARDATGLAALADDSGLAVAALNGMPGVLSARWSGPEHDAARNNALLLAQLADTPPERRGAAFHCAVALVLPDGIERVTKGRVDGTIGCEPRGAGGFGYDPLFRPTGFDRTFAEFTAAEKDAISHRGRALRAMVELLVPLLGPGA